MAKKRRTKTYRRLTTDIILRNDFHNTTCKLHARYYRPLTKMQLERCRKILCGRTGCDCGGILKQRGPQDVTVRVGFDIGGRQVVTLEPLRRPL